jgi:flagellar basal-body rod modification protein FlgD
VETTTVGASTGIGASTAASSAFNRIKSEDFMQLLIQQLQFQDPLEPVSNEELVSQISQIRDMEMNTNLTRALETLTLQQQFGMSASLIGKYIESSPADANTPTVRGVVASIEYRADGSPVLRLDTGTQVPLADVGAITTLEQLARDLVGLTVQGATPGPDGQPVAFEGRVQSAEIVDGQLMLTLENGQRVPFRYVLSTV